MQYTGLKDKFPSPYGVSFIPISMDGVPMNVATALGFRLLTEYHSFLWSIL